jgi:hypothetical protein
VLGDLRVGVPARVGRRGGVVRVLHVDLVVNLSPVVVWSVFFKCTLL